MLFRSLYLKVSAWVGLSNAHSTDLLLSSIIGFFKLKVVMVVDYVLIVIITSESIHFFTASYDTDSVLSVDEKQAFSISP